MAVTFLHELQHVGDRIDLNAILSFMSQRAASASTRERIGCGAAGEISSYRSSARNDTVPGFTPRAALSRQIDSVRIGSIFSSGDGVDCGSPQHRCGRRATVPAARHSVLP